MVNIPILNAESPRTIPAKAYDKIWIEEIIIRAPNPNGDAVGEVKFTKYGVFDNVAELDPSGGTWISVSNLLSQADNNADLQNAITSLMTYIAQVGIQNNIISSP